MNRKEWNDEEWRVTVTIEPAPDDGSFNRFLTKLNWFLGGIIVVAFLIRLVVEP